MEKLYTIKQVSESWSLSERTIHRYIADGRLHHYKIGSNVKFSEKHLNDFLGENEY